MKRIALIAAAALAVSCNDLDAGGGGDTDKFQFSRGYVFQRPGEREIFIADEADYQLDRKLTSSGSNSRPHLSADGRTVVFVHTNESGRTSIRRVPAGGGSESEVVAASPDFNFSDPWVTPDGGKVVFISTNSGGGESSLSVVNIDGSGGLSVPQSTNDASPSLYPGAADVLTFNALSRNELSKVQLSSGVRASRVQNLANSGNRAVLSPDGKLIAYEAQVGSLTRIFVVAEDGSGTPRQVSNTDGNDTFPTWVGGTRLGFTSDSGGAENIYEIDVNAPEGTSARLKVPIAAQGSYGGQ